jgi:hypothetical protein
VEGVSVKKPVLLSYSIQRRQPIHIERTDASFSAIETGRAAARAIGLALIGAGGVVLLMVAQMYNSDASDILRNLGGMCACCGFAGLGWELFRRSGNSSDHLEITSDHVLIHRAAGLRVVTFPTHDLRGVICDLTSKPRRLRVIRNDSSSETLFEGHTAKLLEEVEFECRMFLSSIRPSPMVDVIIPPRPKR